MLIIVPILGSTALLAFIAYRWFQFQGLTSQSSRGQVDGEGRLVEAGLPAGVDWDRLVRIEIVTTDQGPFQEDVFWFFINEDGSVCPIPGSELGGELLDRVSALPGVHFEAVIQAMGSCEDARFLVWSRAESESVQSASDQSVPAAPV